MLGRCMNPPGLILDSQSVPQELAHAGGEGFIGGQHPPGAPSAEARV